MTLLLFFPKAADLAQNRPLWRMMSTYGRMALRNRELHARNDDDDDGYFYTAWHLIADIFKDKKHFLYIVEEKLMQTIDT